MTTNEINISVLSEIEELEHKTAPSVTIHPNTIVWDS
jgi:hypothetical protein